jgi:hypothetical protein
MRRHKRQTTPLFRAESGGRGILAIISRCYQARAAAARSGHGWLNIRDVFLPAALVSKLKVYFEGVAKCNASTVTRVLQ